MSVATAAPPTTPSAHPQVRRTRWSERISAGVAGAGLQVAVLALTLAWIVPTLGLLKLGARDVMGYTVVVFLALTPLVLILVTLLGLTLPYPL